MKLKDLLLTISEETTSSSVATYNKPVKDSPIKRTGFMTYVNNGKCRGCNIIKTYGWTNPSSTAKELKCTFCGAVHKKQG